MRGTYLDARDAYIRAKVAAGQSYTAVGYDFHLTRARIEQIVNAGR